MAIRYKLGFIVAGLSFIILSMFLITWYTTSAQKTDGLLINLGGRQRMLSQKMSKEIGPDYDYFQFVNLVVKESETILLPPGQLPWRHAGDINYARYFLYPRAIINSGPNQPCKETNYIILTSETENGMDKEFPFWPNFPVRAKELIIYNFDTKSYQTITKDWNPKEWVGKSPWGLIKTR